MRKMRKMICGMSLGAALSFGLWIAPTLPVQAESGAEAAESISATKKKIPVYRKSLKDKEKAECLFYEDIPNVPYMSVTAFAESFYNIKMDSTEKNGVFTLRRKDAASKGKKGQTATVNVNKDTLVTDDYTRFVEPVSLVATAETSDVPFAKPDKKASATIGTAKKKTLNFKKEGIDLRETDGVLYAPLATLSDMYTGSSAITVYYNGNKIYFDSLLQTEALNVGHVRSGDKESMGELGSSQTRTKDMAEFSYKELCFAIDHYYGFPCTKNAFHNYVKKNGLDAAIKKYDKKLRKMLLSTDRDEYLTGLFRLFNYWMNDGGHTGIDMSRELSNYPRLLKDLSLSFMMAEPDTTYKFTYAEKMQLAEEAGEKLAIARVGGLSTSSNLTISGDTAVISFEEFVTDPVAWKKFYQGKGKMPTDPKKDTYGFLQSCLAKIKKNAKIKNIVLDVAMNGGGEASALAAVEDILMGGNEVLTLDEANGIKVSTVARVDRNLDGKLDAKDKKVSYKDYNIAVLTSQCSFSSANALPAYAKDHGYMVMGVRSGGGSCAISVRSTADGIGYLISSQNKLISRTMSTVDDGVPVNAVLSKKTDGVYDYKGFYDIDEMSRQIHKYYKDYKSEWVDGRWYNAKSVRSGKLTGEWRTTSKGKKYRVSNGTVLKKQWARIDGKKYYFNKSGIMAKNEYRQGWWVNKNGQLTKRAKHVWKKDRKGWKYTDAKGNCVKNKTVKIGGRNYRFDASGYCLNRK